MFKPLVIPSTIAAGPGPGNTDPRVLDAFSRAGIADHMHPDVLRGMREIKFMLRSLWGTKNVHTFGIAGTGWNGLDCLQSAIMPGDRVVAFNNGTFSGIDCQTISMKASLPEDFLSNPIYPTPANVKIVNVPHGTSVSGSMVMEALEEFRPMWAHMSHWETGSGRINDVEGFNRACEKFGVLGLIDSVSSLGVDDFSIDDYTSIVGWASCPQKGVLGLPLTYAPVSFQDKFIDIVQKRGCYNYVHHPILAARHWGIIDRKDVDHAGYHQTHSCYAVASFHEALRIILNQGRPSICAEYKKYEVILRNALMQMGCHVTSNMTSLLVFDLPSELAGMERQLVENCRTNNFGIWATLSEPLQIRIGILNQLTEEALSIIISNFADALVNLGKTDIDKKKILKNAGLSF